MVALDQIISGLPRSQRIVFELIAVRGYSEKQAAAKLQLSVHTVHSQMKSIYRHFKVSGCRQLMALVIEHINRQASVQTNAVEQEKIISPSANHL